MPAPMGRCFVTRALPGHALSRLAADHDVDLIMSVSERVVCMANGQIIADASPEQARPDADSGRLGLV